MGRRAAGHGALDAAGGRKDRWRGAAGGVLTGLATLLSAAPAAAWLYLQGPTSAVQNLGFFSLAWDVAVDGSNDVFAVGETLRNPIDYYGSRRTFSVVRIAGGTGVVRWRRELGAGGQAQQIVVTADGGVVVQGQIYEEPCFGCSGGSSFYGVVKFASGGTELWRRELTPNMSGLAAAPAGGVYVAGHDDSVPMANFGYVTALDADGVPIWVGPYTRPGVISFGQVFRDPAGDLIANGGVGVAKINPQTGAEIWWAAADQLFNQHAVDGAGNIAVVEVTDYTSIPCLRGLQVKKLHGVDGSDAWMQPYVIPKTNCNASSQEFVAPTVAFDASGNVIVGTGCFACSWPPWIPPRTRSPDSGP